jgi:TRAP-type C4-dicarboxylate transport system substrate-binding protein
MNKRTLIHIGLAASLLATASVQAATLRLSSWLPAGHPIVKDMIVPWTQQVAEATDGRVTIEVLPKPLGNPPSHFDLAMNGIADVTYGVHGYQPGRFLLTKSVEFPFLGNSAESVSVAYWRMYKKHFEQANEHAGVQVLSMFTHGPGQIYNAKRPVKDIGDLSGLKIRVGGGVVNDVAKAIGVTPLLKPAPTSYELMANGVADGVFFPKESIKSFKLTKLVRHATLVPDGLYNVSFFLVMNPKSFAGLSKQDQEAVMKVSGENFARLAGKAWDKVDVIGVEAMKADGVQVIDAPDALVAQIKERTGGIEGAWVDAAKGKGVDGAKVMTDLRAEIAKVAAGN